MTIIKKYSRSCFHGEIAFWKMFRHNHPLTPRVKAHILRYFVIYQCTIQCLMSQHVPTMSLLHDNVISTSLQARVCHQILFFWSLINHRSNDQTIDFPPKVSIHVSRFPKLEFIFSIFCHNRRHKIMVSFRPELRIQFGYTCQIFGSVSIFKQYLSHHITPKIMKKVTWIWKVEKFYIKIKEKVNITWYLEHKVKEVDSDNLALVRSQNFITRLTNDILTVSICSNHPFNWSWISLIILMPKKLDILTSKQ